MAAVKAALVALLSVSALLVCCQGQQLVMKEQQDFEPERPVDPSKEWAVDKPILPPVLHSNSKPKRNTPLESNVEQADAPAEYQPILKLHNNFRALHQALPLAWDPTLAQQAADHAANCTWVHDSFGENLYVTSRTADVAGALTDAVLQWYSEIVLYSFAHPGFDPSTGHFSQVVWRSSKQLGCAAQVCADGIKGSGLSSGTLVVCRYLPFGNVGGQFARNVFPPIPAPNATVIPEGSVLLSPDCYVSQSREYQLCMRRDGKLLLTKRTLDGDFTLWSTNTRADPTARTSSMQAMFGADGTFKVLDAKETALWSISAAGKGVAPRRLALQDDGNLVLYDANNVTLWQALPPKV